MIFFWWVSHNSDRLEIENVPTFAGGNVNSDRLEPGLTEGRYDRDILMSFNVGLRDSHRNYVPSRDVGKQTVFWRKSTG